MKGKRAIVSVINDLSTDQRVHKTCMLLQAEGYDVLLIGRKLKGSLPVDRPYGTRRMRLLFTKGAAFYAAYNWRLFWSLLFRKADLLYANDLDTLLANYLVSRLRRKTLVYDSHEFFTEVPELEGRKFARGTWLRIERWIFPKLKHVLTVNESIANEYGKRYGVKVHVLRNLPESSPLPEGVTRQSLDLPEDRPIVILQGAGINVDRGGEELVEAMQYLDNCLLLIVGSGDVLDQLKERVKGMHLNDRVRFIDKLPYPEMMKYTICADVGATLDKDSNLNYRYSLPNKVFDYIKAGTPVLASDLVEVKRVLTTYGVGKITPNHQPKVIAETVRSILNELDDLKQRVKQAAKELTWDQESEVLRNVIRSIG